MLRELSWREHQEWAVKGLFYTCVHTLQALLSHASNLVFPVYRRECSRAHSCGTNEPTKSSLSVEFWRHARCSDSSDELSRCLAAEDSLLLGGIRRRHSHNRCNHRCWTALVGKSRPLSGFPWKSDASLLQSSSAQQTNMFFTLVTRPKYSWEGDTNQTQRGSSSRQSQDESPFHLKKKTSFIFLCFGWKRLTAATQTSFTFCVCISRTQYISAPTSS